MDGPAATLYLECQQAMATDAAISEFLREMCGKSEGETKGSSTNLPKQP